MQVRASMKDWRVREQANTSIPGLHFVPVLYEFHGHNLKPPHSNS